jgi:predicted phage baseplate assembly protein
MALKTPVIDDRRYDDIVEEIKVRIARYTSEWKPAWTDFNDSDPGITLAHVYAWLSEMLLYRMAQVPELNYVKFLELLGVTVNAAAPALAEVTFTVQNGVAAPWIDVPPRTQVAAAVEGGPPLVFETERGLRALTATLQSVQVFDGGAYRDVTDASRTAAASFPPFGELAPDGAALVLGVGFPAGHPNENDFPAVNVDLAVWIAGAAGSATQVTCGAASAAFAPARLRWEGWAGTEWQAIDLLKDETLAFTRTGHVVVRTPGGGVLRPTFLGTWQNDPAAPKPPLFWLRARLDQGQYERVPELLAVRTNTVPALQAQTVEGEVLGGTSGARSQRWQLANTPVVKGSVHVVIDDGTGEREWTIVEDFLGAAPTAEVLVVNRASGEVFAGDGEEGAIPVANATNPDTNVVAREYRYGGGRRGNVAAGTIKTLATPVDGIDAGGVENLFPAAGGRDEEELEEAKRRARRDLRARDRAVTAEDFQFLAEQAGNVKRARALPLVHPQFPGVRVPGAVTVVVVPDSPSPKPMPSEGTLRAVCAYLDARRLLTTEVFVVAPTYQEVTVQVELTAADDADAGEVKEAVQAALTTYLDPLRGGDDSEGWPFGGTIRYSKVYQRVFTVPGVDSVNRLVIRLDGEDQPECRDIPITPGALLFTNGHQVTVQYAFEMEAAQ